MFQVPLYWGCIITMLDTFTFLFLDSYGRRKLEVPAWILRTKNELLSKNLPFLWGMAALEIKIKMLQFFFAFLITVMAVSFGINYFVDIPDQVKSSSISCFSFELTDRWHIWDVKERWNQNPPGRSSSWNSCSLVGEQRCSDAGKLWLRGGEHVLAAPWPINLSLTPPHHWCGFHFLLSFIHVMATIDTGCGSGGCDHHATQLVPPLWPRQ